MKKKIFLSILVILIATICVGCGTSKDVEKSENAIEKYNDGISLIDDENYESAIKNFNTAIKNVVLQSDDEDIDFNEQYEIKIRSYYYIAECYSALKMDEQSDSAYHKALQADLKTTSLERTMESTDYLKRAIAQTVDEDYDNALSSIDEGLKCSPCESKQALMYNKIYILEQQEQWSSAHEVLLEYKEAYPDDTRIATEEQFLSTR